MNAPNQSGTESSRPGQEPDANWPPGILDQTPDQTLDVTEVQFHLFPGLSYVLRMLVALGVVASGFLVQAATDNFWVGLPLLFVGSILLTVKGHHNRVEAGAFDPAADWEIVSADKLDEILALDRKMLDWNQSWMDVTNSRGILGLVLLLGPLVVIYYFEFNVAKSIEIFLINAAVLLTPHWVTGLRDVARKPKLIVKIGALKDVRKQAEPLLKNARVSVLMLLSGKPRMPDDIKLKIEVPDTAPEFLGIYLQVVTNEVKGTEFPYVYCVLVARQGYGLLERTKDYQPPNKVVKETKLENEVEIVILRQHTTKTSGYHTDEAAAYTILRAALELVNDRLQDKVT